VNVRRSGPASELDPGQDLVGQRSGPSTRSPLARCESVSPKLPRVSVTDDLWGCGPDTEQPRPIPIPMPTRRWLVLFYQSLSSWAIDLAGARAPDGLLPSTNSAGGVDMPQAFFDQLAAAQQRLPSPFEQQQHQPTRFRATLTHDRCSRLPLTCEDEVARRGPGREGNRLDTLLGDDARARACSRGAPNVL